MKKISVPSYLMLFFLLFFVNKIFSNPVPSATALSIMGPTTITMPGYYTLSKDIQGTLTIAASKVQLDLKGHSISSGFNNIEIFNEKDITIQNGTIENAINDGIFIDTCTNLTIKDINFLEVLMVLLCKIVLALLLIIVLL